MPAFGAKDVVLDTIKSTLPELNLSVERGTPRESTLRQAPPKTPPPSAPQKTGAELYGDWIKISSVRKQAPYLITLTTNIPKEQTLAITGWVIEGRAERFTIPKGVELIPEGIQGAVYEPIVLQRGDRVRISGAENPFTSKLSFKPNACFGYLKDKRIFPVSVPSSCPRDIPKLAEMDHLPEDCQEFILDFRHCKEPLTYPSTSPLINDFQCRTFYENLEFKLSYDGCVKNHKAEDNFFREEWHIYVDEEDRLVRSTHDRILLKDQDGVIIDEFVY